MTATPAGSAGAGATAAGGVTPGAMGTRSAPVRTAPATAATTRTTRTATIAGTAPQARPGAGVPDATAWRSKLGNGTGGPYLGVRSGRPGSAVPPPDHPSRPDAVTSWVGSSCWVMTCSSPLVTPVRAACDTPGPESRISSRDVNELGEPFVAIVTHSG